MFPQIGLTQRYEQLCRLPTLLNLSLEPSWWWLVQFEYRNSVQTNGVSVLQTSGVST